MKINTFVFLLVSIFLVFFIYFSSNAQLLAQTKPTNEIIQGFIKDYLRSQGKSKYPVQVIGMGSWISNTNYKDPLNLAPGKLPSDHDLRLVVPDDMPAEQAISKWKDFQQYMRKKIGSKFPASQVDAVLNSVTIYPPEQLIANLDTNNQVMDYFKNILKGKPNLGSEPIEGYFGRHNHPFRLNYERMKGRLFYLDGKNVVKTTTDLQHAAEGLTPFTTTNQAKSAQDAILHTIELAEKGDIDGTIKQMSRVDQALKKSKDLKRIPHNSNIDDIIKQLKALPTEDIPSDLVEHIKAVMKNADTEAKLLQNLDYYMKKGAMKEAQLLIEMLTPSSSSLTSSMRGKLWQLATELSADGFLKLVEVGLFSYDVYDSLQSASEEEYDKAYRSALLGALGSAEVGLLPLAPAIIADMFLDYVKAKGYTLIAAMQDCEFLMAGICNSTGRAQETIEKPMRDYSPQTIFENDKPVNTKEYISVVQNHLQIMSHQCSVRWNNNKDRKIEEALYDRCLTQLIKEWNEYRLKKLGELSQIELNFLNSIEHSTLAITAKPETVKLSTSPDNKKEAVSVNVKSFYYSNDNSIKKLYSSMDSLFKKFGGSDKLTYIDLKTTYIWKVNGNEVSKETESYFSPDKNIFDPDKSEKEFNFDKSGTYSISLDFIVDIKFIASSDVESVNDFIDKLFMNQTIVKSSTTTVVVEEADSGDSSQTPDDNSNQPDDNSNEPDDNSNEPDNNQIPDNNSNQPDDNSNEPDDNSNEPDNNQIPDNNKSGFTSNNPEPDTISDIFIHSPDSTVKTPDSTNNKPDNNQSTKTSKPDTTISKPDDKTIKPDDSTTKQNDTVQNNTTQTTQNQGKSKEETLKELLLEKEKLLKDVKELSQKFSERTKKSQQMEKDLLHEWDKWYTIGHLNLSNAQRNLSEEELRQRYPKVYEARQKAKHFNECLKTFRKGDSYAEQRSTDFNNVTQILSKVSMSDIDFKNNFPNLTGPFSMQIYLQKKRLDVDDIKSRSHIYEIDFPAGCTPSDVTPVDTDKNTNLPEDKSTKKPDDNISATITGLSSKIYFGSTHNIAVKITSDSKGAISSVFWDSSPNLTFNPQQSSSTSTAVTFDRMQNPTRIWANINIGAEDAADLRLSGEIGELESYSPKGASKVETEQKEVEVISPEFSFQYEPSAGDIKIGKPVIVTIVSKPAVPDSLIDYKWVEPTNKKELANGKIEIIPEDNKPIKLHVIARVPGDGDTINDDITDTITASEAKVTASVKGPKFDTTFKVWNKQKGMVEESKEYAIDQQILLTVDVEGVNTSDIRYQWSVEEGCSIAAGVNSKELTISMHEVGTCTAKIVVSNKEGHKLGEDSVSVDITISQEDLDMAQKAQQLRLAKEKFEEAKKLYQAGKIDEAIKMAEEASTIDPKNADIKTFVINTKAEKTRYTNVASDAKKLIEANDLTSAQNKLDPIPVNFKLYQPVKDVIDLLKQKQDEQKSFKEQAAKKLTEAKINYNNGEIDQAVENVEEASKIDPDNAEAKTFANKVNSEKEQYLNLANQAKGMINNGQLDSAKAQLAAIPSNFRQYPPIKEVIDLLEAKYQEKVLLRNKLAQDLNEAIGLAAQCKYTEAIAMTESIMEQDPYKNTQKAFTEAKHYNLQFKNNDTTIKNLLAKAEADLAKNDYKSFDQNIFTANSINKYCPQIASLKAQAETKKKQQSANNFNPVIKQQPTQNNTQPSQNNVVPIAPLPNQMSNNVVPIAPLPNQIGNNVVPIVPGVSQNNVVPIAPLPNQIGNNVVPIAPGVPQNNVVPIAPIPNNNVIPIIPNLPAVSSNIPPTIPKIPAVSPNVPPVYSPTVETKITDNGNLDSCSFTSTARFNIAKPSFISKIDIWYNWQQGQTTLPYTIRFPDGRVKNGTLHRIDCDPYQHSWCKAIDNVNMAFNAGSYVAIVPDGRICQNSGTGGNGVIRIYAGPIKQNNNAISTTKTSSNSNIIAKTPAQTMNQLPTNTVVSNNSTGKSFNGNYEGTCRFYDASGNCNIAFTITNNQLIGSISATISGDLVTVSLSGTQKGQAINVNLSNGKINDHIRKTVVAFGGSLTGSLSSDFNRANGTFQTILAGMSGGPKGEWSVTRKNSGGQTSTTRQTTTVNTTTPSANQQPKTVTVVFKNNSAMPVHYFGMGDRCNPNNKVMPGQVLRSTVRMAIPETKYYTGRNGQVIGSVSIPLSSLVNGQTINLIYDNSGKFYRAK